MNKNLYLKELKRNRKNLLIWMSIAIGFTLMVLAIYPAMAEMGEGLTDIMANIPPELGKAMGMDAETWSSILGFYSTYYGVYIIVLVSIYTTSTATTIVSKEEKERTAEFLLTKPVSRKTIFISKIASLFTLSLIIYLVQSLVAIIGINAFSENPIDWSIFLRLHAAGLFLMILFTAIGVLLSMYLNPKKNFMGIVVGLTFGTYFLNAIAKSTESTEWIGYFSPFNYFNLGISDPGESFRILAALVFVLLAFGALFIAFKTFNKKDIAS